MNTKQIKDTTTKLEKYAPKVLSFKAIGKLVAYQQGFVHGYLIRTGRQEEIEKLLKEKA